MLMPSPEIQKRLEKYQTHSEIEADALKIEWRRSKRRRNGILRAFAGLALISTGVSIYNHDVENNKDIQAGASIAVEVAGQALDEANNDEALVFIDGFGSYNADTLTKYMSKAVQPIIDGQLWSVDYNNAPLETSEIARNIIETAEAQNVTTVSLIGYSAGGDVAMQVQEEIIKESDLSIKALILTSTPDGADALRPARQDEIDVVEKFSWIPGVQYSTPLRFLGELAFRADAYNSGAPFEMIDHFFATAREVDDRLTHNRLPGTWLMFDQMLAIENANLEARINEMKNIPKDRIKPVIIYLGTADPGYDYMVDDKKSSDDIGSYAEKAEIPFFSYDVPGAVHTRIDLANDQYIKTLADAKKEIQAALFEQESDLSLRRVTSAIPATPSPK